MYAIVRIMKTTKDCQDLVLKRFEMPSILDNFDGFVKKELYVNKKNKDYDVYRHTIYFADKNAYYRFEGSAEHIALHKNKDKSHLPPAADFIIEVSREEYQLLSAFERQ